MNTKQAKKILILGGTREAAVMAEKLVFDGHVVTTSLAGRTREPAPVAGEVRSGGFGGVAAMAAYLKENHIDQVIDMTHPFALQISKNAKAAALLAGVELVVHQRPQWERQADDRWVEVANLQVAVAAIPTGAIALLALGSQHIAPFAVRADVLFIVRMVDPPLSPLPLPKHELIVAKPGTVEEEFALLHTHKISIIVCRNSGGQSAYTKIAAARLLGLEVIMINRAN